MTLNGALPADAFAWPRDHRLRRLPVGSMNGYTNAHGLARVYDWALSAFPAATLTDLTTPRTSGPDLVLSAPAMTIEQRFSRGFEVITADTDCGRVSAFGHHGLGGATAFADPAHGVAFAYTTATARLGPPGADPCAAHLIRAVYSCLSENTPPR